MSTGPARLRRPPGRSVTAQSPRKSRSVVEPTGSGGTPSNVVMTYSLKSAFGQPKSARENLVGSSGLNDSCSRWSPGSSRQELREHVLALGVAGRGESLHQHRRAATPSRRWCAASRSRARLADVVRRVVLREQEPARVRVDERVGLRVADVRRREQRGDVGVVHQVRRCRARRLRRRRRSRSSA